MTTAELKTLFEKEYNRAEWTTALRDIFHIKNLHITPHEVNLGENPFGASALELGSFETSEGLLVGLYEVNITPELRLDRNKVGLRNLMRKVYSSDGDAALMVFTQGHTWRFTYASELTVINKETGKREARQTDPKRYTYIFGQNQQCRTAVERFAGLKTTTDLFKTGIISIREIEKAFSVDTLTKDFYKKLSDWYFWALTKVKFPTIAESSNEVNNATSLIRLITRLIFVWFMKQKGLIPNELFDKEEIDKLLNYTDTTGSTYYKAILQNLFFATLNTPLKDDNRSFVRRQTGNQDYYRYHRFFRNKERFLELTSDIPFLNGGLFDNLDKRIAKGDQEDVFIDCFSNHLDNETLLTIPDFLFFGGAKDVDLSEPYDDERQKHLNVRGLIDILHSYNFTIEENTPLDIQIALDPEMLGLVFENLLASYNPETKTTARKQTGSFYTPREIVNYMVNESLVAYLKQKLINDNDSSEVCEIKATKLSELVTYSCYGNPFDDQDTQTLVHAIDDIKVLDPACGSGAFPMGILHQLVNILQKLDPKNELWRNLQINKAEFAISEALRERDKELRKERLLEIEYAFDMNEDDYGRKLFLIENCIYGVDIQPIAVQIAKLRFFISLLCEQDFNSCENNRGIKPLPNLDFKIVAANTLIAAPKNDAIEAYAREALENFDKFTTEYFYASIDEKPKLKNKIKTCTNEILKANQNVINQWIDKIKRERNSATGAKLKSMNDQLQQFQLALDHWDTFVNLFKNQTVSFFETKYFFPHVKDGFDVVIGNPPYVQLQKDGGKLANELKSQNFETFEKTGDIYALFYEKGFQILKNHGIHTFITSSQWMKAGYGKSLRKYFLKQNPLKLILLGPGVFENATVDTNILVAQKGKYQKALKGCEIENNAQIITLSEADLVDMAYVSESTWTITNPVKQSIKNKIEKHGKQLIDWDLSIYFGIKTGYNEAFIIDRAKRNELVSKEPKSEQIIRPILRGRGIEKYVTVWEDDYIIGNFPSLNIDIDKYSGIKEYLADFKPKIEQIGEEFINDLGQKDKTRKKTAHKWFETQDPIGYVNEFKREKIVWKRIGSQLRFSILEKEIYCLDSTCIATGEKIKYLTALLNSRLCNYQLFENSPKTGMGDLIISVQALEPLYVHYPDKVTEEQIVTILEQILIAKKENPQADTTLLERQIDEIVFKLYDLTYEEVKVIDPAFWLSEEEYNLVRIE